MTVAEGMAMVPDDRRSISSHWRLHASKVLPGAIRDGSFSRALIAEACHFPELSHQRDASVGRPVQIG